MSLLYNVSTLLREGIGSVREYDVDDRILIDDTEPRSERVAGHTTFLRTNKGVLVTAHLTGLQHEVCSRCVRDLDISLEIEIEEEFFATVDANTGVTLKRPDEPEAFLIDGHQELDLEEAARQAWVIARPMRALCRPDCRGLCPTCGKDLNEGACACPPAEDERWGALRPLVIEREGM